MEYGTLRVTLGRLRVSAGTEPFSYLDLISGNVVLDLIVYEPEARALMSEIEMKKEEAKNENRVQ